MKLISLHIENFGCLHQYDLKFSDGLTVIREDNGFGKTTLAEFIRAMFYGFPRAAKTLDRNKRKKYLPWSGGKCGGHLTFELEGTAYRIERTFGATPRGDTFNLIDLTTNQKSTRFTEEIGVELFRLDGESFERSTYMPQIHEAGALTTDSIRAKLGDLVEDTNDINNFDKAVTALKNKRSAFVPYRGSGGSVAEARAMVSRLQEELDRAEGKRNLLASAQEEIRELEAQLDRDSRELAQVREQITAGAQAAAAVAVRRQYEDLLTRYRQTSAALAEERRFENGVPGSDAFEEAGRDCEQYLALAAELQNVGLSDGERAQSEKLNTFFAPGVPEEEKLDELSRLQREVLRLRTVAESRTLSLEDQRQLEILKQYFKPGVPDEKAIDGAGEALEQAARLRQENLRLAMAQPAAPAKQSGGRGAVIALVIGIVALAAGIGLMTARSFLPGGILLGAGLLALIGAAYLGMKRMVSGALSGAAAENRARMDANEAEAVRMESEVRDFVRRYSRAGTLADALREIRDCRMSYQALLSRMEALAESRGSTEQEMAAAVRTLNSGLAPYFGEISNAEQAILELRMKSSRMLDLQAKKAAAVEREQKLLRQADELREKLQSFLGLYFESPTPGRFRSLLTELQRDCEEYTRTQKRLTELEQQLTAFRAEHGAVLAAPAPEEKADLESLKRTERQLSDSITEQTRRQLEQKQLARQLREETDRIPQLRDALELWQDRKDADQKKSETLDRTLEYLQQARDSLSGNYLGTIQKSFGNYLGRMTGEDREKILVTGDLEVRLERQGQARELAYFSAGQTDLVMLCMRFALVDALFSDVKPFVILDDPFVNLDDERTEQALALLKDLARDRQILYLVCNSSRA